jgi:hypothetical protein
MPDSVAQLRPTMRIGQRLLVDLVTPRRVDVADPKNGAVRGAMELMDDALRACSVPLDCLEVRL